MKLYPSLTALATAASVFAIVATATQNEIQASEKMDGATYSVTFVPSWNPETHPNDYPITHGKKGLLTPAIGATHTAQFELFAEGMKPTPGLETLSEMGAHAPLDEEIRAAVAAGNAGALIAFTDASPGPVHPPVTHQFDISERYPLVSLVGMIAPSPDWFYGVSNVSLLDNGSWVPSIAVEAYAWDSGGDNGTMYLAEDADNMAKQPTTLLDNAVFKMNGKRIPVGVFVFKRVPSSM